ncbi:uncharacterized protein FA14DRAFT_172440 [Meira miltonrushii]|uniref:S-adenosyl-L-methionine-dependent methyltransferase n=1 Tax=Meira miltonrushii TaxID=1280837 RepID=A0A316VDS8_9BASI|nr:uncharacterized protein FA14DRAFT_172440 [Meira miltonrushii]PWN35837.1 hypothetical protein FA14DRAFT_172440 [Meira miltonrushii]
MVQDAAQISQSITASLLNARRKLFLQFSARLAPKHPGFCWPSSDVLIRIQDDLIEDLQLGDSYEAGISSGDDAYLQSFLKELLARLERYLEAIPNEQELEINGDLLATYAMLMATANSNQPGSRSVTHYLPVSKSFTGSSSFTPLLPGWNAIQMEEEGTTISRGTTGLKTWEASLRLAGHLVAHPGLLEGPSHDMSRKATILELGCGVGLLGVVARYLSPPNHKIIMTDLDGEVLDKARKTAEEHWYQSEGLQVHSLDWIDVQEQEQATCQWLDHEAKPDIVIAADIVFDPLLIAPLCSTLALILHRGEKASNMHANLPFALIASTVRNPSTFQLFRQTLAKYNLHTVEVDLSYPMIDLNTLEQVKADSNLGMDKIPLLPSTHDAKTDGQVCLLHITSKR